MRQGRVPPTRPHGLLGTWATTAVDLGLSLGAIQQAIGHTVGGKATECHYIAPGALGNVRGRC